MGFLDVQISTSLPIECSEGLLGSGDSLAGAYTGLVPLMQPRLLVVDDEPGIRALVRKALSDTVEVLDARNGAEALELLLSASVDLVLLDLSMPMMGGLDTLAVIRANSSLAHLPVVVFTGQADRERIGQAIHLGAADCLAKPFSATFLRSRLHPLIRQLRGVDGSVRRPGRRLELVPDSRVLVVDRSPIFRRLAADLLGRLCQVHVVDNEFAGLVEYSRASFDAAFLGWITDWSDPETTARRFRQSTKASDTAVVAVAPPETMDQVRQKANHFDAVLPRCLDKLEAETTLASCLGDWSRQQFLLFPGSAWLGDCLTGMVAPMSAAFGVAVTPQRGPAEPLAPRWVVATLELHGPAIDHILRLRCPHASAIHLARVATGQAADEVSDRLTHIVVGDLATRVAEELQSRIRAVGLACEMGEPTVGHIGPSGSRSPMEVARGASVRFHADDVELATIDLAPPVGGGNRVPLLRT